MYPRNVYLCDPDRDDQLFFKQSLSNLNKSANLFISETADELLQKLIAPAYPDPDVLFMDIDMPLITGTDCLKKIRHIEGLKDLTVVIYSTSKNTTVINEAYELGGDLYIRKPYRDKELELILKYVLELYLIK